MGLLTPHGPRVRTCVGPRGSNPGDLRPGRVFRSKRGCEGSASGMVYLVRVFVDVDRDPAEVVTVYRTSKVEKYWK